MQLDRKTELLPSSSKRQKITIANDYLQRLQRIFALVTILIPFLGAVLATGLIWGSGVGAEELWLLVNMYVLTFIGITVGFHRHFAHGAFKTNTAMRIILAIFGSMAAQGPIIHWVSNHRRHHQYSDLPGDPHSPHFHKGVRGLYHAHIGWMLNSEVTNAAVFAKDLLRDSAIAKVNQLYLTWVIMGLAIPSVLGGVVTGTWMGAWQGLLWGGLIRIFLAHHATWSINSITHLYGNRSFNTQEQSKNNFWLAIPTFGEAWHNNHHAFPFSGKFGLKWWQIDLGYWIIRVLEFAALVWEVKVPTAEMIEAKKSD